MNKSTAYFTDSLRNGIKQFQQSLKKEWILNELRLEQESERRTQGNSDHYQRMGLQPIEVIESWLTTEQFKGFLLGNILKYIGRYNLQEQHKGGVPDLRKALDYLNWLIDVENSDGMNEEDQDL